MHFLLAAEAGTLCWKARAPGSADISMKSCCLQICQRFSFDDVTLANATWTFPDTVFLTNGSFSLPWLGKKNKGVWKGSEPLKPFEFCSVSTRFSLIKLLTSHSKVISWICYPSAPTYRKKKISFIKYCETLIKSRVRQELSAVFTGWLRVSGWAGIFRKTSGITNCGSAGTKTLQRRERHLLNDRRRNSALELEKSGEFKE